MIVTDSAFASGRSIVAADREQMTGAERRRTPRARGRPRPETPCSAPVSEGRGLVTAPQASEERDRRAPTKTRTSPASTATPPTTGGSGMVFCFSASTFSGPISATFRIVVRGPGGGLSMPWAFRAERGRAGDPGERAFVLPILD